MDISVKPRNDRARSESIGPLATLPVFFDLKGKTVLVAGGSAGAAWKAELLLAAGAEVHWFCPADEICAEFQGLLLAAGSTPPSVALRHLPLKGGEQALGLRSPTAKKPSIGADIAAGPLSPLEGEMSAKPTEGGGDLEAVARPSLIHHNAPWTSVDLEGFALAVGDCDSDAEARAFHRAAILAGVPVNVIDKPDYCQFKFGSIVNRSPVVIAISTDGAAPILGQAIRRRIETLLPPALSQWAALAQSLRDRVTQLLAAGAERRRFWEAFVDRAFLTGHPPSVGEAASLIADAGRIRSDTSRTVGRVTLVGAGPGDAELLTLKAVRALQAADVILFDDLVSADVLELARREARRMLVGKRGGRDSCRQEDINDMMVALAKSGKRVVRLKSGDPMIFGRAGEEIARLRAEGIPVDVVPGITSASAMASRLGVSLTHRDHAQSVRFVTGHARNGELPANLDWRALGNPAETTIYYMGGRTAAKIRASLLGAGMDPATPAVVMTSISRAEERRWMGTVDTLLDAVRAFGVDEPILIGIGNAFSAVGRQSTRQEAVPCHQHG